MAISQLADYSATPPPTDEPRFRGFERSQQSRGDRSGAVGAEAINVVASVGRIGEKKVYLLFDYTHKAYDCEAIRLRYNMPPTDESPTHKKRKSRLLSDSCGA